MKKVVLLILLFCSNANWLYAQEDSISTTKYKDTIRIGQDRFYYQGKRISETKMEPLLQKYNSSALEYKRFNKNAVPGGFLLLGGLVSGVLALANVSRQTHFWTPYSIGEFGLGILSIPFLVPARKHFKKSVRKYNMEVLH